MHNVYLFFEHEGIPPASLNKHYFDPGIPSGFVEIQIRRSRYDHTIKARVPIASALGVIDRFMEHISIVDAEESRVAAARSQMRRLPLVGDFLARLVGLQPDSRLTALGMQNRKIFGELVDLVKAHMSDAEKRVDRDSRLNRRLYPYDGNF